MSQLSYFPFRPNPQFRRVLYVAASISFLCFCAAVAKHYHLWEAVARAQLYRTCSNTIFSETDIRYDGNEETAQGLSRTDPSFSLYIQKWYATVTRGGRQYVPLEKLLSLSGFRRNPGDMAAAVFVHKLRGVDGRERLVVVEVAGQPTSPVLEAIVIQRKSFASWMVVNCDYVPFYSDELNPFKFSDQTTANLQIMGGQCMKDDPASFQIPFWLGGHRSTMMGTLTNDDHVKFTVARRNELIAAINHDNARDGLPDLQTDGQ